MNTVLIISTFFTGIIAGLFFAWAVSVMNGLAKLPDREFITAMQSMNRGIQNPVFFLFFFGTLILLPVCVFMSYRQDAGTGLWLIVAAMLLYIAVMAITMAGNVPLNNMLDNFPVNNSSMEDMAAIRKRFEDPWNRLNITRAICNMLSFLLLLLATFRK